MSEISAKIDKIIVPAVYAAINAVQSDLCADGIAKDRKNTIQGFSFRGIDAVYNALSPLLVKHGLLILPRCTARDVVERHTAKGNLSLDVTVTVEYDFIAIKDGSIKTVGPMYGQAMDTGDKATSKAMSIAYKYAVFEAFSIPLEGSEDADSSTTELGAQAQSNQVAQVRMPESKQESESKKEPTDTKTPQSGEHELAEAGEIMFITKRLALLKQSDPDAILKEAGVQDLSVLTKSQFATLKEALKGKK